MEKIVFDCDWIKVKKTPKGYYFSERKGIDSVAILLYRKIYEENLDFLEVLVRKQALPILNSQSNDDKDVPQLFECPITGGIDDGYTPLQTMIKECREESGYLIDEGILKPLGLYYVGTQTNEVVYMGICDVTKLSPKNIEGDGTYFETIAKNVWMPIEKVLNTEYSGLNIMANKLYNMWKKREI